MKLWNKMTGEELALHLELWIDLDGRVESKRQVDFFQEIIRRLTEQAHMDPKCRPDCGSCLKNAQEKFIREL